MRSKQTSTLGLALLALGLGLAALPGCSESGDTKVLVVPLAGNYPGGSVADNNLAADGLALSENGESVVIGPRTFHSSTSNRAIILYVTATNSGTGVFKLWATYFDGKGLTPPVEIIPVASPNNTASPDNDDNVGLTQVPVDLDRVIVMFYDPSDDGGNRDTKKAGDAVILYGLPDVDEAPLQFPPINTDNQRVWWVYHDRSLAKRADMAHGFGTFDAGDGSFRPGYSDIVDSDDGLNVGDTNEPVDVNDVPDFVWAFGVVSDGIIGRASWDENFTEYHAEDFGDFLVAVWTQTDEVNDPAGVDDAFDIHMWQSRFDITADPPQFAVPSRIGPSSNTLESQNVMDEARTLALPSFFTYENAILFSVLDDYLGENDEASLYNRFSGNSTDGFTSGGFFGDSVQYSPTHDITDGLMDFGYYTAGGFFPPPQIYGSDHNLSNLVVFHEHVRFELADPDIDLWVSRFDTTATTGPGSHTPSQDSAQVDETGATPVTPRDVFTFDTRISRESDWILLSYVQEDTTLGMLEVRLRRFTTDEIGGTPVGGPISSAVGAGLAGSDDTANADAVLFRFQNELGSTLLPPREGKGVTGVERGVSQSDNDAMYLVYEENDDGVTAVDQLHVVRFEHQPAGPGLVSRAPMDDYPDGTFGFVGAVPVWVRMLDDGAGGVNIYYSRDRNFKDNTLPPEFTLSVRNFDGTTMTTRTDLNTPGLGAAATNFAVLTTGATDPAGDRHLIAWGEDRYSNGVGVGATSSMAFRARTWPKMEMGDVWDPASFTPTNTIDADLDTDAQVVAGTLRGSTSDVAVYIAQGGHIYYNEYNSRTDTWKDAADYIVDNDSSSDAIAPNAAGYRPFDMPDLQTEGETARSIVWWLRLDQDGDLRLHARIHK